MDDQKTETAAEAAPQAPEAAPAPAKRGKKAKTVRKRGKATIRASAGSAADAAADKVGSQSDPEVEELLREERELPALHSKVGLTLGMTRSLGNFEFARVDVYVEDFCETDKKKATFEALHKEATAMVGGVVKDIDAYLKKKRDRQAGNTTVETKAEKPEQKLSDEPTKAVIDTSNMGF